MHDIIDIKPVMSSPEGELILTSYKIHKITDEDYELVIEYSNDKQKATLKAPIKNIVWDINELYTDQVFAFDATNTKIVQFENENGKEITCPTPKSFYSKYKDTSKDNTIFTIYIEDIKNNLIINEDLLDIL